MPVYVRNDGPRYTRKGENEDIAQQKAYAFKSNWPEQARDPQNPDPNIVTDLAWSSTEALFADKGKMGWIRRLTEEYGLDLLACTESDVRTSLTAYIFDRTSGRPITKITSITDICKDVRGIFRDIGREYAWGDRQDFRNLGQFLVDSGNPMTSGTENELKKQLRVRAKAANASTDPEKLGGAVSAPFAYINLVWHLSQLVQYMQKWSVGQYNQYQRIENLAYLTMLLTFCMHEGCRYTEVIENLTHGDMYLPLNTTVYWLTLAVMNIDTLTHLLTSNGLPYYVMGLFKGKKVRDRRPRMKAVIPAPYNSLDLLTVWTFCMRCILTVNPEGALRHPNGLVIKNGNYSGLRKDKQENLAKEFDTTLTDLTFYTYRYSGAIEDEKASGIVEESWTEYRMGHKKDSRTKERYASNRRRVMLDDAPITMGMEVFDEPTYKQGIQLEFLPMVAAQSTMDTTWLDKAFANAPAGLREDFERASALVSDFVRTKDPEPLSVLLKQSRDISWIEKFPMGFHINFPEQLMTPMTKKILDSSLDIICSTVAEVGEPKLIPELWSFPQIMYGNWRSLMTDYTQSLEKPPLCNEPPIRERKRPRLIPTDSGPEPVADSDPAYSDADSWSDGFRLDKIEKGDHVVIFCTTPGDKCALALPLPEGSNVFVAKVMTMKVAKDRKSMTLKGKFYFNPTKDATAVLQIEARQQTLVIQETSVLEVMPASEGDTIMQLEQDEIATITTFLADKGM